MRSRIKNKINLCVTKTKQKEANKQQDLDNNIKMLMTIYFEDKGISRYVFGIAMIIPKDLGDSIEVEIWIDRPGIFIGRQGKDIGDLEEYLTRHFDGKPVRFKIKEHNPFKCTYRY